MCLSFLVSEVRLVELYINGYSSGIYIERDRLNENQIKEVTEDEIVTIRVKEFSKLVETYLLKGGVIDTTSIDEDVDLDEEINALPLHEVRDFINTYNRYFMTNYKVEEFIISEEELNEKVDMGGARVGTGVTGFSAPIQKKPGTIKKFIAKVKKYATWAKKQWTRDYNPVKKGTALNP